MLHDDLGSKVKAMAALAPVMFVGNQTSPFVELSIKYGIDALLINNLDSILWLKKGSGLLADIIIEIAPRFIQIFPRFTWSFVQCIVGIDKVSHIDPARMPMMAVNDVGGTGTINLKHWDQNMRTGRFSTLVRKGEPTKDYPVEKLVKNLENTDVMLFVGENDALSQAGDVDILINSLPKDKVVVNRLKDYNHLDYMWAQDAHDTVNIKYGLINFIESHQ